MKRCTALAPSILATLYKSSELIEVMLNKIAPNGAMCQVKANATPNIAQSALNQITEYSRSNDLAIPLKTPHPGSKRIIHMPAVTTSDIAHGKITIALIKFLAEIHYLKLKL